MKTMQFHSGPRSLAAALLAGALLVSCGGDEPEEAGQQAASTPGEVRVTLTTLPDYRAEGLAVLTRSGDRITADVAADTHLGPGDYGVHIHEGTCEEGGRVVVPLTSINGGESGSGHAATTFDASELPSDGTYFIQVHRSNGDPVACGDVPALDEL